MSARRVAFDVLRQVTADDAYANLALAKRLATAGLDARDAGLATELVSGTCRLMGSYDLVIEAAAGRKLSTLQPAVLDLLRLGCHQLLSMGMAKHAAVGETVNLARETVGQRVTGLVNAVLRKVARKTLLEWLQPLTPREQVGATALHSHHPRWIAQSYVEALAWQRGVNPRDFPGQELLVELATALSANNDAPRPTLVVRPGLAEPSDFDDATPTRFSRFGATSTRTPAEQPLVRDGKAGVQDEGSQLVAWALANTAAPEGPWLDMCAGPGGKAALLAGLARESGTWLLASEAQEHRARLVRNALSAYPDGWQAMAGDGTRPAWRGAFARVMADVPCTGLGALRRRPESRWRRSPNDIEALGELQRELLRSALDSAAPGGVVAYVTCSPHRAETVEVVDDVVRERPEVIRLRAADSLPDVPDCAVGDYVQLWPHIHGTDAMFLALLRVPTDAS